MPLEIVTTKHQVSISGDYLLGSGHVTLPVGFSLSTAFPGFPIDVLTGERESDYLGSTISYSYGQKWYFDLSYARGTSKATAPVPLGGGASILSDFTIDDEWYQFYVRYAFPGLRGKRFSAYLRAGVSYVNSSLRATDNDLLFVPTAQGQYYSQKNDVTDILGNIGFGLGYSLYSGSRARVSLQFEGEGFYGGRGQKSIEEIPAITTTGNLVSLDNSLSGGLARSTIRFEYTFGKQGLLNFFADGGIQGRYSFVEYEKLPSGSKSFDELLWGPYAKLGLSYSF